MWSHAQEHTFRILEIWITVNTSITDIAIAGVENISQLTGLEGAWHSSYEDCLAGINWLGVVHDVIAVTQPPGSDLYLVWLTAHNHTFTHLTIILFTSPTCNYITGADPGGGGG